MKVGGMTGGRENFSAKNFLTEPGSGQAILGQAILGRKDFRRKSLVPGWGRAK